MQVYFSEVPSDILNDFGNEDYFQKDGKFFYFLLTLDDDGIYIEDTIGRYVPIDIEAIEQLAVGLDMCLRRIDAVTRARNIMTASDEQLLSIQDNWNLE